MLTLFAVCVNAIVLTLFAVCVNAIVWSGLWQCGYVAVWVYGSVGLTQFAYLKTPYEGNFCGRPRRNSLGRWGRSGVTGGGVRAATHRRRPSYAAAPPPRIAAAFIGNAAPRLSVYPWIDGRMTAGRREGRTLARSDAGTVGTQDDDDAGTVAARTRRGGRTRSRSRP
jgi:hypothetical protein